MKYEYIVPMGEECYTCASIDAKFTKNKLREHAFPFDYVGHVYIETILERCKDLLNGHDITPGSFLVQLFGENYFYSDKVYKFHYWHDTTYTQSTLFTEKDRQVFVEKYKRRYERLRQAIQSNLPIMFFSVNHFDSVYKGIYKQEKLLELYDFLFQHNPNMHFLAVNYSPESFTHHTLRHVTIDVDRTLPFKESKLKFTNDLQALTSLLEGEIR
jgi:hypothetical protein